VLSRWLSFRLGMALPHRKGFPLHNPRDHCIRRAFSVACQSEWNFLSSRESQNAEISKVN
jgi:hypothetical protein